MECTECGYEMTLDSRGEWQCSTTGCSKSFTEADKESQRSVLQKLLEQSFESIYKNINTANVKAEVDEYGIDKFIKKCARFASGTGFMAGAGGFLSMAAALPVDLINTVAQHFRVAIAVTYHQTGSYDLSFENLMKVVGISLGVRIGTFGIGFIVAREIIKRLIVVVPAKSIPLFGGVAGAGVNYAYIMAVGKSLKAVDLR